MRFSAKLTFGKYKGQEWKTIPFSYILWMAEQDIRHGGYNWSEMAREHIRHSTYGKTSQDEIEAAKQVDAIQAQYDEEEDERFYQQTKADAAKVLAAYRERQQTTPMSPREFEQHGLAFAQSVLQSPRRDDAIHAYSVVCLLIGIPLAPPMDADPMLYSAGVELNNVYGQIAEALK